MKKIIYLLVIAALLIGCATVSRVTPRLSLGMTKKEVLAKCGRPYQSSAVEGYDGKIYETFTYKETLRETFMGDQTPVYTYVHFVDDKVVYYGGSPKMPIDQIQQSRQNENK